MNEDKFDEPSSFDGVIGMRIYNKLIEHAYETGYKGTDKKLFKSIDDLENVVRICRESIGDVIQGEIEVMSVRVSYLKEEGKQATPMMFGFMGGLIHAREVVESNTTLIGKDIIE